MRERFGKNLKLRLYEEVDACVWSDKAYGSLVLVKELVKDNVRATIEVGIQRER
jgi:hypothetical protein